MGCCAAKSSDGPKSAKYANEIGVVPKSEDTNGNNGPQVAVAFDGVGGEASDTVTDTVTSPRSPTSRRPSGSSCDTVLKVPRKSMRTMTRQAAGHESCILKLEDDVNESGEQPTSILKKLEDAEVKIYESIYSWDDPIQDFVPSFFGVVAVDSRVSSMSTSMDEEPRTATSKSTISPEASTTEKYMRLGNLLVEFRQPFVMDCKMGVRSFVEAECSSKKPRPDLFERMRQLNPDEPTEQEKADGHITKHRWMTFRDKMSSSHTLGFRVDGIAGPGDMKLKQKDFASVRDRHDVVRELLNFLPPPRWRSSEERREEAMGVVKAAPQRDSIQVLQDKLLLAIRLRERLQSLKVACESSEFFRSHEFVGASLLMAAEAHPPRAEVFVIDFAKTARVPEGISINHRSPWELGNHEDGFLFGIDNCLQCWSQVIHVLEVEVAAATNRPLKPGALIL